MYWSDEDQRWIVDVPELPGCIADGKTPEEALETAKKVLAMYYYVNEKVSLGYQD